MDDELAVLCRELCRQENQPHQWTGKSEELRRKILDLVLSAFECQCEAHWKLTRKNGGPDIYICVKHLTPMVLQTHVELIESYDSDDRMCDFRH